mmetsp:Transcript_76203/g.203742  ORF Transcript_76203/g.203742 Transcript_76203/m.203742 type:complete len:201 (+) Transcript_76203:1-603(+)
MGLAGNSRIARRLGGHAPQLPLELSKPLLERRSRRPSIVQTLLELVLHLRYLIHTGLGPLQPFFEALQLIGSFALTPILLSDVFDQVLKAVLQHFDIRHCLLHIQQRSLAVQPLQQRLLDIQVQLHLAGHHLGGWGELRDPGVEIRLLHELAEAPLDAGGLGRAGGQLLLQLVHLGTKAVADFLDGSVIRCSLNLRLQAS